MPLLVSVAKSAGAALRRLPGSVRLILAVWVLDLAWAARAGVRLGHSGTVLVSLALLLGNLWLYRGRRGAARAEALLFGVAAFFALASGTAALSYLAARANAPLADAGLARADAALGFDWLAWFRFVQAHPWPHRMLAFAYASMPLQILACLLALPLAGMAARNREFILATAFAVLPTIALFAAFPAASAWAQHGIAAPETLHFFRALSAMRAGQAATIQLGQLDGLVTFPSFHAAVAVLLANAARGTPVAFLAVVLNLLMIVSTLSEGGHYLVDVLAGVAIAALAIGVARRAGRRFDRAAAAAL